MEAALVIAIAAIFGGLGVWLGSRIGYENGKRASMAALSNHLRAMEKDAAARVENSDRERKATELKVKALEADLRSARDKTNDVARDREKLRGELRVMEKRWNVLISAAESVAATQSRNSIVNLQTALESLQPKESKEEKKKQENANSG